MNPTLTKLTALVNNWLTQVSVKRDTLFILGFGLRMTADDVSDFLTRVLKEQDFDFHNPMEVIYWYCYCHQFGYNKAVELKEAYNRLEPDHTKTEGVIYANNLCLDTEESLMKYLSFL